MFNNFGLQEKRYVIHCETQEEYNKLMKYLEKNSFIWHDTTLPTQDNNWKRYKELTCIDITYEQFWNKFKNKYDIGYCDINYATSDHIIIIPFKQIEHVIVFAPRYIE